MPLQEEIKQFEERIRTGGSLSREEALSMSDLSGAELFSLIASANRIRHHFRGDSVSLCSIINAKSGACSEDCSFCAQSSRSKAEIEIYPLLGKNTVLKKAKEAKKYGIKRFSIVTSGKKPATKDLLRIADLISGVRDLGLLPCASLGLLNAEELKILKKAGLDRYHHNLETSERFFSTICATHTFTAKIRTIEAVKAVGLSLCSGGIFGMGETWQDRIDMAFLLKELDVASVPINFLIPIKGTPLENRTLLHPFEALCIFVLFRFILPRKEIRACGGRVQVLNELQCLIFPAGADGMITGNYLTTLGRSPADDINLIETMGLSL